MLLRCAFCFFALIALASCGGGTSNTIAPTEAQQTGPLTVTPAKPASSGGRGPYLYALNSFGLAVYDESTKTLAQSFILACQPGEGFKQAMFSADHSKLYLLTFSKAMHYYFNVLDTTTNTFTGTIDKLPVQSIGTDMWNQNYYGVTSTKAPTSFVMVDMSNQSVLSSASFPTDAFTVSAPVVDPATGFTYPVDDEGAGGPGEPLRKHAIKTFNPATPNAFVASYDFFGYAGAPGMLDASGAWLYFRGVFPDFFVGRMNTKTGAMQRIAPDEGNNSGFVAVTPDGTRVFDADDDGVRAFDVASGNQVALIPTSALNFAFGTKTNTLYANAVNQISAINPTTNTIVATMPLPAGWPSYASQFTSIYSQ